MSFTIKNFLLLFLASFLVACGPTDDTTDTNGGSGGAGGTGEEVNYPEQPTNPGYTETEYEWDDNGWNRKPVNPVDPTRTTPIKSKPQTTKTDVVEEDGFPDADTDAYLVQCDTTYKAKYRRKRCTKKFLDDYIYNNLEYPETDSLIEGEVVIRFVVEADGDLSGAEVIESLSPEHDREALRLVKHIIEDKIKWTPALLNDEPVPSYFVLPIEFKI